MKKRFLILGLLVISISGMVGYNLFNKSHRSVMDEEAIEISAVELFERFEANEADGNNEFLDKVIEVRGEVAEILTNQEGKTVIILATDNPMFGVSCTMEGESKGIEIGATVSIKGICVGYLSDVVINRAIITK